MNETATPIWAKQGTEKREAVRAMFGKIAPSYDRLNGILSLSMHRKWRAQAVGTLNLKPGNRALDVCCGTGDFLIPLRSAVGEKGLVLGIDFSLPMLSESSRKGLPSVALGDACRLPVRAAAFDSVSVGWGLRNVSDLDAAFAEAFRALKPGGRFVSLDMARPANGMVRGVSRLIFERLSPWLGGLFGAKEAYAYLPQSTLRFATREELRAAMERAGFVSVGWKDFMLGNICMHWGQKP